MGRFDYRKLSAEEHQALLDELLEVMAAVRTKEALQNFFLQLVSPSEAVMLARRWQIAKRLAARKSYYDINRELAVGMSTIQSVDHWLSEAIGDYAKRVEEEERIAEKKRLEHLSWRLSGPFPQTLPFLLMNVLVSGARRMYWEEKLFNEELKKHSRSKKPTRRKKKKR